MSIVSLEHSSSRGQSPESTSDTRAHRGLPLLTFEIIELFLVPFDPVMHPLLIAWSLAILLLLPFTGAARQHLEA